MSFPNSIFTSLSLQIYVLYSASTNLDTWFYALLNEEQSAYLGHPHFINAWLADKPPDWSTNITYDIQSPVISYGGQYAMTFTEPAGLWVKLTNYTHYDSLKPGQKVDFNTNWYIVKCTILHHFLPLMTELGRF
jgi:hypothetical protein